MPIEKTANEIRYRVKPPSDFQPDSFRSIPLDKEGGISAIIGRPTGSDKTEIQSLRFDIKKWDEKKVEDWAGKHNYELPTDADEVAVACDEADMDYVCKSKEYGGAGSGNFGHAGRIGERGGSSSDGGGSTSEKEGKITQRLVEKGVKSGILGEGKKVSILGAPANEKVKIVKIKTESIYPYNSSLTVIDKRGSQFDIDPREIRELGGHYTDANCYSQLYETTKDIFSAGKWNGDEYSESDLDEIVKNFIDLKERVNVPLKVDIFKKDAVKEMSHGGLPAVGWVDDLKRVGKKLYAHIVGIPKTVKDLIENKAYRTVSAEIVWNYNNGKSKLRRVLTGVALLGADIPAVTNLDEFAKLYGLETEDLKTYAYESNEKPDNTGNKSTEEDKVMDEKLQKDFTDKIAKLEAEKKAETDKATRLESEKRSSDIKVFVDEMLAKNKILPAHKDSVVSILENISDSKTVKFMAEGKEIEKSVTEIFKSYIVSLPELVNLGEKTKTEELTGEKSELKTFTLKSVEEFGSENTQKVAHIMKCYAEAHKDWEAGKCYTEALKNYPELA